jgi:hypothetical protein
MSPLLEILAAFLGDLRGVPAWWPIPIVLLLAWPMGRSTAKYLRGDRMLGAMFLSHYTLSALTLLLPTIDQSDRVIDSGLDWFLFVGWIAATVGCGAFGFSLLTLAAQRALRDTPIASDYFAHRLAAIIIVVASLVVGMCTYWLTIVTIYPIGMACMFIYEGRRTMPHLRAFIEAYEVHAARGASEVAE